MVISGGSHVIHVDHILDFLRSPEAKKFAITPGPSLPVGTIDIPVKTYCY